MMNSLRSRLEELSRRAILPSNALDGVRRRRAAHRRRTQLGIGGLVAIGSVFVITSALMASDSPSEGDEACASLLVFNGVNYSEYRVAVQPILGDRLGVAVVPACSDGDGQDSTDPNLGGGPESIGPDIRVEVARVQGVDPRTAIALADDPSSLFVNEGIDPLPPELDPYFEAPGCKSESAPVRLRGKWLSILGADGETELDMAPPYDVEMLVEDSTVVSYERATLRIRVPPSLGHPLTREDIRGSLWKGGDLQLLASCSGDSFVAESIEVMGP